MLTSDVFLKICKQRETNFGCATRISLQLFRNCCGWQYLDNPHWPNLVNGLCVVI